VESRSICPVSNADRRSTAGILPTAQRFILADDKD
jgi:hypothetical protein